MDASSCLLRAVYVRVGLITAMWMFTADFLSFSCAAVNPVIYYAFNVHYRQGLKEFASCCSGIKAPQMRDTILKSVKQFQLQ